MRLLWSALCSTRSTRTQAFILLGRLVFILCSERRFTTTRFIFKLNFLCRCPPVRFHVQSPLVTERLASAVRFAGAARGNRGSGLDYAAANHGAALGAVLCEHYIRGSGGVRVRHHCRRSVQTDLHHGVRLLRG